MKEKRRCSILFHFAGAGRQMVDHDVEAEFVGQLRQFAFHSGTIVDPVRLAYHLIGHVPDHLCENRAVDIRIPVEELPNEQTSAAMSGGGVRE
jgi:hypothetical protein